MNSTIERIIAVADERLAAYEAQERVDGLGFGAGCEVDGAALSERMHAWAAACEPLLSALATLSDDELRHVAAVMYAGRGDGAAAEMAEVLASWRRDRLVRAVREKLPLGDYLRGGLALRACPDAS